MRVPRINLVCLAIIGLAGFILTCGEDDSAQTPPIEEWCDIDRPRQDCVLDEFININAPIPEEASVLCESRCTRLRSVSFANPTPEVLKALAGYESATGLTILGAEDSLQNLESLASFESISSLKIDGNSGLESLKGLENLAEVATTTDDDGNLNGTIEIIDNPNLKSVSALSNVRSVGLLSIHNNSSLVTIDGFSSLERATNIQIEVNRGLRSIRGFEKLEDMRNSWIFIERNRQLNEFDAFKNVNRLKELHVVDNSSLSQCRVESFLEQLASEPEVVEIEGNNTDCQ